MEIEIVKDSEGKYKYDLGTRRVSLASSRLLNSRGGRGITAMVRLLNNDVETRLGSWRTISQLEPPFVSIPAKTTLAKD